MAYILTKAATNITKTGARLHAEGINLQEENWWQGCFYYGDDPNSLSEQTEWQPEGDFYYGNQAFYADISELPASRIIYFRARIYIPEYYFEYGNLLSFASLSPRTIQPVTDLVTLEAFRNIEMSAMGRIYIDEEGDFTYESRHARNP